MNPGYVYIFINPSMPGLIKIGRTIRDSRERARELWTTGVPTPFQVAFEIFSEEYDKLETLMHNELADFRVHNDREFFKYPLYKAVKLLQELNSPPTHKESIFAAEDITERLRQKYPSYIKQGIIAVRLVQPGDRVWLETTEEKMIAGNLRDQIITRTDLGFISGGDYEFLFNPDDNVSINANKFINDFDAFSICMTTNLFHDDACHEIGERHYSKGAL